MKSIGLFQYFFSWTFLFKINIFQYKIICTQVLLRLIKIVWYDVDIYLENFSQMKSNCDSTRLSLFQKWSGFIWLFIEVNIVSANIFGFPALFKVLPKYGIFDKYCHSTGSINSTELDCSEQTHQYQVIIFSLINFAYLTKSYFIFRMHWHWVSFFSTYHQYLLELLSIDLVVVPCNWLECKYCWVFNLFSCNIWKLFFTLL